MMIKPASIKASSRETILAKKAIRLLKRLGIILSTCLYAGFFYAIFVAFAFYFFAGAPDSAISVIYSYWLSYFLTGFGASLILGVPIFVLVSTFFDLTEPMFIVLGTMIALLNMYLVSARAFLSGDPAIIIVTVMIGSMAAGTTGRFYNWLIRRARL